MSDYTELKERQRVSFLKYFPSEYSNYSLQDLFNVVCESCGKIFGSHSEDKCGYSRDGSLFVAPRLSIEDTYTLPDDLFKI